jgi:hypothetical protein
VQISVVTIASGQGRDALMKIALATAFLLISCGLVSAQDLTCNQQQSQQEVRRLTSAGTIVSVDVFLPDVTVVVDDRTWQRSDVATKTAIARSIDCATGGPNNKMLHTVVFRSNKSNDELGEFSGDELKIPSTAQL